MDHEQRQTEVVRILTALEPEGYHAPSCGTGTCHDQCQVGVWARYRAKALDEAGLLCALEDEPAWKEMTTEEKITEEKIQFRKRWDERVRAGKSVG